MLVLADLSLREALAETDRLDPGWRLDELEAQRQIVPDEENSALQILKAKVLIPRNWWKDEHELSFENLPPERQLSDKQLDALRKGLKPVDAALVEARRLADMPHGRFATDIRDWHNAYNSSRRPAPSAICWGTTSTCALRKATPTGRWYLAGHCSMPAERSATSHDSGHRRHGRCCDTRPFSRWSVPLPRENRRKQSCKPYSSCLRRKISNPAMLITLRGERASSDLDMHSLQKGSNPIGTYFAVPRGPAVVAPWPRDPELRMIGSGSLKGQRAALLRAYNNLVEAAKLPPEQAEARLQQVMTSLRTTSQPAAIRELLGLGPWVQRGEQHAVVRAAIVALAAERYRRQHGRWPDTLDALVPAFLPKVPLDPHDGGPLRYRRLPEGVIIYSVGPDMIDNGGKLDRQDRMSTGVDIGVQLWEPNRRRQPPAPQTQ